MKQLLRQMWKKYIQRLMLPLALMILITLSLAVPTANATGVYQMPNLNPGDHTWVIDQAEVLSRSNEGTLGRKLDNLAEATGNELRLVTIRRLDYGETIESFTKGLFEKWFPTPTAQANQTLLVIDTLTNGSAIRSGDEVKSRLTDDIANSVISETLLAPLRAGDKYNQALLDVSNRLVAVLSGQADPGPPQIAETIKTEGTFKSSEETEASNATIWVIGLLVAATVIPMATYYLYQILQS
ncbi:MAG: TPM domain-containing protein [Chroococcidiopsidaceae cyanobacterium CP_BM_ER_R8_30]|nr:TPM domain-containing protein [Chroococcidiopsidaceae cyanobacterium CP_BM_ER_R8_30]